MRKKILAISFIAIMLLSACAVNTEPRQMALPTAAIVDVSEVPNETWAAMADFSQELFRQVLLLNDDENVVISPLSAYYALTMAALGANGVTLDEFANLLRREPVDLAPELAGLAQSLMSVGGRTMLNLAGSVWVNDEFTVHPSFNRVMTDYFSAPAFPRDFSNEEALLAEINAWIYDKTNGLIGEMIDEIPADAVMYLINTLYMLARWSDAFYPMTKTVRTFTPENGETRRVDFVNTRTVALDVRVTNAYEAVLLPYDCGRLGFFMVRPTNGTPIREFAANHNLANTFARLEQRDEVRVFMPTLDKEFDIEMNDMLKAMGLVTAFTQNADFMGLVEYSPEPIEISTVQQAVRIIVDAYGTEAAAATVVEMIAGSARPQPEPLVLDFNTPYIYAIYDLMTGVPLFMGVVDNPN